MHVRHHPWRAAPLCKHTEYAGKFTANRLTDGRFAGAGAGAAAFHRRAGIPYFMVGMTNSAPARMPVGQREVTVLSRVKKRTPSGPCIE